MRGSSFLLGLSLGGFIDSMAAWPNDAQAGNTAIGLGCVGWIAAEAPAVNGAVRP